MEGRGEMKGDGGENGRDGWRQGGERGREG